MQTLRFSPGLGWCLTPRFTKAPLFWNFSIPRGTTCLKNRGSDSGQVFGVRAQAWNYPFQRRSREIVKGCSWQGGGYGVARQRGQAPPQTTVKTMGCDRTAEPEKARVGPRGGTGVFPISVRHSLRLMVIGGINRAVCPDLVGKQCLPVSWPRA